MNDTNRSFDCPHCASRIPSHAVNVERQIATCASCNRLVDLAPQMSAVAATEPRPRIRPPVPMPVGLSIKEERATLGVTGPGTVVVSRRWFRPKKHLVMLAITSAAAAGVAYWWLTKGAGVGPVMTTLIVTWLVYMLLTMFVNTTVVRASRDVLDVKAGPIPSPVGTNVTLRATEIKQVFAAEKNRLYGISAVKTDGAHVDLVTNLITAEQALFIEQQIERALGLVDFEIPGEIGSALPKEVAGPTPKGGGSAVLGVVAMAGIGGAIFFLVGSSEARGELVSKDFTFTAKDCESGQPDGYFGVEIQEENGSRVVRLMQDPVRGNVAIIAESGSSKANVIVDAASCKKFELDVQKTSTTINDVRVLEGHADLECEALTGRVEFEGCH